MKGDLFDMESAGLFPSRQQNGAANTTVVLSSLDDALDNQTVDDIAFLKIGDSSCG